MTYSRNYLDKFKQPENFGTEEHMEVTQSLIDSLTSGENLSLAEEDYVCFALSTMHNGDAEQNIPIDQFEGCKNYLFRSKYICYFNDLDGYKRILNSKGEINQEQKEKDRKYFEDEYQIWLEKTYINQTGNQSLDYLTKETRHHIKDIRKFCSSNYIGHFRREYLIKSIVLHSKFIYLLVTEYFEEKENNRVEIELKGSKIQIDSYCYIHILFRHFASQLKLHQADKSYHFDRSIHFRHLPDFIVSILECYNEMAANDQFNNQSIGFIYNETMYEVWFKSINNGTSLRLQTLYPVENPKDRQRLNNLTKIEYNEQLTFLMKNAL